MSVIINGDTGIDKITDGSIVTADIGSGVPLGKRNLIINGDMRIDQRNEGSSVDTTSIGNSTYSVDRWAYIVSVVSKFTLQQSSDAPTGLNTSLLITSSSAYSSLNTDFLNIRQMIEGVNFAHLGWGTAEAKTVTLSFWVKSSLTGSFSGSLQNSAFDRSYPFEYTISSANTWEQKSITIEGDTTGTWLTTNGIGCRLNFNVGNGSDYLGTVDSWSSSNLRGVTGTTALTATNGATLYITGVQLEVGDAASDFEFVPYDMELARCQRYYYSHVDGNTQTIGLGNVHNATTAFIPIFFPVTMRSAPALVYNNTTNYYYFAVSGSAAYVNSLTVNAAATNQMTISGTISTSLSIGTARLLRTFNADAYIHLDAEL